LNDNTERVRLSSIKSVKDPEAFAMLRFKAQAETDQKEGFKLFQKTGKTILALIKNGISENIMNGLSCFWFKY